MTVISPAKAVLGVVAVAGAFLAVGGQAVPDQLMGHAPVTDKLDGDVEVLQHGLMAPLDDVGHKGGGAGAGDFILGLIAHPPAHLNVLEYGLAVQRGEDFKAGRDDFHALNSSLIKWGQLAWTSTLAMMGTTLLPMRATCSLMG